MDLRAHVRKVAAAMNGLKSWGKGYNAAEARNAELWRQHEEEGLPFPGPIKKEYGGKYLP